MKNNAVFKKIVENVYKEDEWQYSTLLYEYRDHQYTVTKYQSGSKYMPLWKQHEAKQRAIDAEINDEIEGISRMLNC